MGIRNGRIIGTIADKRTVNEIPVDEEGTLQRIDHTALQPQHGIAPRQILIFPIVNSLYIAKGDIHASHIAYTTVYDDELAVVAIVGLAGKGWEMDGKVRMNFRSTIWKRLS